MKKRQTKAAPRRKVAKPPNDTRLINECVVYAQSIGAYHGGFEADSDGYNSHAAALGNRYYDRARQALTKITATPAATPEGLCSKARIAAVVFHDNEDGRCLEIDGAEFLKSFAVEVEKFLQPICNGQVTLQMPATEGGAS